MPMEYIVPSLRIANFKDMEDHDIMKERMAQLISLEEDRFIEGFHQHVQKAREEAWHERHIKKKKFLVGYLILLYDSKFVKFPGKFKMHWLGPYIIKHIIDVGTIQLVKLNGELIEERINGSMLKLYRDNPIHTTSI